MWSWSDIISPWDVKQYVYCPVIPWIARIYGVREPETYSMKLGAEERAKRMAGIADAVAGAERYTVVEVKLFKRRKFWHFKAQLMAYALLSEECIGPTIKAALVIRGKPLVWDVDSRVLIETRKLALRVRETLESEKPPFAQPCSKCSSCWYARVCPAR